MVLKRGKDTQRTDRSRTAAMRGDNQAESWVDAAVVREITQGDFLLGCIICISANNRERICLYSSGRFVDLCCV